MTEYRWVQTKHGPERIKLSSINPSSLKNLEPKTYKRVVRNDSYVQRWNRYYAKRPNEVKRVNEIRRQEAIKEAKQKAEQELRQRRIETAKTELNALNQMGVLTPKKKEILKEAAKGNVIYAGVEVKGASGLGYSTLAPVPKHWKGNDKMSQWYQRTPSQQETLSGLRYGGVSAVAPALLSPAPVEAVKFHKNQKHTIKLLSGPTTTAQQVKAVAKKQSFFTTEDYQKNEINRFVKQAKKNSPHYLGLSFMPSLYDVGGLIGEKAPAATAEWAWSNLGNLEMEGLKKLGVNPPKQLQQLYGKPHALDLEKAKEEEWKGYAYRFNLMGGKNQPTEQRAWQVGTAFFASPAASVAASYAGGFVVGTTINALGKMPLVTKVSEATLNLGGKIAKIKFIGAPVKAAIKGATWAAENPNSVKAASYGLGIGISGANAANRVLQGAPISEAAVGLSANLASLYSFGKGYEFGASGHGPITYERVAYKVKPSKAYIAKLPKGTKPPETIEKVVYKGIVLQHGRKAVGLIGKGEKITDIYVGSLPKNQEVPMGLLSGEEGYIPHSPTETTIFMKSKTFKNLPEIEKSKIKNILKFTDFLQNAKGGKFVNELNWKAEHIPKKAAPIIAKWAKKYRPALVRYGSSVAKAQMGPAMRRNAADIDIQFIKENQAEKSVLELFPKLQKALGKGNVQMEGTLISFKQPSGTFAHGLDIHTYSEAAGESNWLGYAYTPKGYREINGWKTMKIGEQMVRKATSSATVHKGFIAPATHRASKDIEDTLDIGAYLFKSEGGKLTTKLNPIKYFRYRQALSAFGQYSKTVGIKPIGKIIYAAPIAVAEKAPSASASLASSVASVRIPFLFKSSRLPTKSKGVKIRTSPSPTPSRQPASLPSTSVVLPSFPVFSSSVSTPSPSPSLPSPFIVSKSSPQRPSKPSSPSVSSYSISSPSPYITYSVSAPTSPPSKPSTSYNYSSYIFNYYAGVTGPRIMPPLPPINIPPNNRAFKRRKSLYKFKMKEKYRPSYIAASLGIFGKKPKRASGVGLRPILRSKRKTKRRRK